MGKKNKKKSSSREADIVKLENLAEQYPFSLPELIYLYNNNNENFNRVQSLVIEKSQKVLENYI